jgi:hypothetical protein
MLASHQLTPRADFFSKRALYGRELSIHLAIAILIVQEAILRPANQVSGRFTAALSTMVMRKGYQ